MKSRNGTWKVARTFTENNAADLARELALPTRRASHPHILIGRNEWIQFPELQLGTIIAKTDSGARTSSLHAEQMIIENDGKTASFITRDALHQPVNCQASIVSNKMIKSSTGHSHRRIVILTHALFSGGLQFPIELTLANRSGMKYPVLLGRRAIAGYFFIDPQCHFLLGGPKHFPPPPPVPL